jgi:hypothetical protein
MGRQANEFFASRRKEEKNWLGWWERLVMLGSWPFVGAEPARK